MRVHVVDPAAATPPYDRALCAALARAGASVELWTSRFGYGAVPPADGYVVREAFHRAARGPAGSRRRLALKLATHGPDMLRHRRAVVAGDVDVVHYQWLAVQPVDGALLARSPRVLTAHDVLPRAPRPGQLEAQKRLYARMDAVVAHSDHGCRRLIAEAGVAPECIEVIPHGAFTHLPAGGVLPGELPPTHRPVVLFFGLIRPYKGLDVLLEAWRTAAPDAELWVVGRPRGVDLAPLRAAAPPGVHWVERFVSDAEARALLERADLVVLPYREIEQSGVLFSALGLGRPLLVTDVGGFGEVAAAGAAALVPPADVDALAAGLDRLLRDRSARAALAAGARAARDGPWSWEVAAGRTLALYERLASR